MARLKEQIILSWSGGKDSVLALWDMKKSGRFDVTALMTVVTEPDERIASHGISRALVEEQARSLNLPLIVVHVPEMCPDGVYVDRVNAILKDCCGNGIHKVAFGDVYLDDLRDFREEQLDAIGLSCYFPLWNRCTKELAYGFLNARFKAVVTAVDGNVLGPEFAGRAFDRSLLADLPITADPCGENGEFHTFVHDGPLFSMPVTVKPGPKHSGERFHYCDLVTRPATRVIARRPASFRQR